MPMANIAPPKASVLSCRKKSPTGGQTQFASTFAAYDALSDEEKAEYEKLTVVHSLVAGVREVKDAAELQPHMRSRRAERPLVWTYPSGRKRSEEHTSELQSLMRISYAVFCLKKKNTKT